jgi:hypothetical protein
MIETSDTPRLFKAKKLVAFPNVSVCFCFVFVFFFGLTSLTILLLIAVWIASACLHDVYITTLLGGGLSGVVLIEHHA